MTDAPDESGHEPPLRVRRLEVVDEQGRPRAVIGEVGSDGMGHPTYGIELVDRLGHSRVSLAVDSTGPVLMFDQGGNNAIYLGVHDEETAAVTPGAYLSLCDSNGDLAIGCRVHLDGSVEIERPRSGA